MNVVPLLSTLAIILLGALVGGRLAALCRLPRVTGYLLVGLLVGPSFAHLTGLPPLTDSETLQDFRLLADLALALIMFNIGGQFEIEHLRRWRGRIAIFSLAEIFTTCVAVALAAGLINQLVLERQVAGMTLGQTSVVFGLFLGIIAVATAPAATLMVVREYEAGGPVTGTVLTLVGLNNFASIFGFALATHFILRPELGLAHLLLQMVVPLAVGGVLGFALSVWSQRLELTSEHKILLLGGIAAALAMCRILEVEPLLAALALGMTVANGSPRWHLLADSLRQIDYPLYVAFFVLAGMNLHLETLAHLGLLGVAYVLARTAGKCLGAALGARLGRFGDRERRYVGLTLLAQAGVAIGLSGTLARQWPEGGRLVETVVLGAVVIFELVGPLAVRHGLVQAGEVPLLSLLRKRAPQGALEGMHSVVHHFRSSLGLPAGHRVENPGDILVRHVMRRNVETVRNDTHYNELLRFIAHSRYDRFPVVNQEGRFAGMINYTEIRSLLFEPSLASLVVAEDLVTSAGQSLAPDQPLREALKTLQLHRDISFFPVIDPQEPERLLGILSQNDVLAAFRRLGTQA